MPILKRPTRPPGSAPLRRELRNFTKSSVNVHELANVFRGQRVRHPEEFENLTMQGGRRRSHIELLASILRALKSDSLTKYEMIFHLNLNTRSVGQCLDELRQKGLVESRQKGRSTIYSITPKGIEWLGDYKKIIQ
jgi:predicted transcriptional regulator